MTCTACPLHLSARTVCLHAKAPSRADVLVVLDNPSEEEDRQATALLGPSADILTTALAGWSKITWAVTHLVKCRTPGGRPASVKERQTCADEHLAKDIETVAPQLIIAMGDAAFHTLAGRTGIIKWAGKTFVSPRTEVPVMACPSPGYVLRNPGYMNAFTGVLWRVPSLLAPRKKTSYTVLRGTAEVQRYLKRSSGPWAFDYETTDLSPFRGKVISVAVSDREGEAAIFDPNTVAPVWRSWLRSPPRKVVHNLYFESIWSQVHFGVEPLNVWDTQLFAKLQDENATSHLKDLVLELTDLGNYAHGVDVAGAGWEGKSLEDLRDYNCGDADGTLRIYRTQQGLLADP